MRLIALTGSIAWVTTAVSALPSPPHGPPGHSCPPPSHGGPGPYSPATIKNLKDHIKNVVVLEMENRAFDNILGGQKLPGLENPIQNGPYCNPLNLSDPSEGQACSKPRNFDAVMDDPDHTITGNNFEFYGTFTPDNGAIASGKLIPPMNGFVHEQRRLYNETKDAKLAKEVMNYYTEEQLPVLTTLVQNFLTFNHWHSDIPGVSKINQNCQGEH